MIETDLLKSCIEEEQTLQFHSFSREDALHLGLLLYKKSKAYKKPVAVEIYMNNLCVFRYYPEGTNANNEKWLRVKNNTVQMTETSSLHLFAYLEATKESLEEHLMDSANYTRFGGGFPINIIGTGCIGSICVSGLVHIQDHNLIVLALREFLSQKS